MPGHGTKAVGRVRLKNSGARFLRKGWMDEARQKIFDSTRKTVTAEPKKFRRMQVRCARVKDLPGRA